MGRYTRLGTYNVTRARITTMCAQTLAIIISRGFHKRQFNRIFLVVYYYYYYTGSYCGAATPFCI